MDAIMRIKVVDDENFILDFGKLYSVIDEDTFVSLTKDFKGRFLEEGEPFNAEENHTNVIKTEKIPFRSITLEGMETSTQQAIVQTFTIAKSVSLPAIVFGFPTSVRFLVIQADEEGKLHCFTPFREVGCDNAVRTVPYLLKSLDRKHRIGGA